MVTPCIKVSSHLLLLHVISPNNLINHFFPKLPHFKPVSVYMAGPVSGTADCKLNTNVNISTSRRYAIGLSSNRPLTIPS